ncbi:MAG: sulfite dehydrogenase [Acidobacteria bacterium]|nr:sulfite dehydrogenase [Acidobacteriota bacterium]
MNAEEHDRRRFLKRGAALAGLAAGAIRYSSGQTRASEQGAAPASQGPSPGGAERILPYGARSRFEDSARLDAGGVFTPLQDLTGIITPAPLHFVVTHMAPTPDIDPRQHRLMIHGMVDRPLIFTLDELKRLPSVSRVHFLQCAGSSYLGLDQRKKAKTVQETHGKTSCSEWTGVLLSLLLKEAGLQKGGSWLLVEGGETKRHTISIPLAKAMDDALVAYGQNGEAVRPEQGYPLRLLAPGFEGVRNVKWLRRIKVVDRPYMSKWESTIYTNVRPDGKARWFQFELEPNSVITFPSGGQRLPGRGFYEVTGLAWSGGGAIRRVEVSTNGGRSWKEAQIQEPVYRMAHTRFRFSWNWNGEEAVLQSRCTDEWGAVQPTLGALEKLWGVNRDYWLSTTNRIQHFNGIQPWKVAGDGSVHNVIWES